MSFEIPSGGLSQADLDASNQTPVYVAVAVGFVLATGGVILRCIARRKSKSTFGWDDYTIVFALILLYALFISSLLSTAKYGLGRHLPAVLSTVIPFQKTSIANITLWLATAAATKASLLILYHRLFSPSKSFRQSIYLGACIVFCQWLSLTLTSIFQCRPVAAFWNRDIQGAKCINLPRFTIVSGVLNLLTDVLILCLPVPMVWGLNTTKTQKVTLTGMFLLGIFVCAISIIRISKLAGVNYDDPTWRLVDVFVWTALENSVGILSACLPTLRPLFGRLFTGRSKGGSSDKKQNSSRRAAQAHFNRLFEEEEEPKLMTHKATEGSEDSWTSPDLAAGNELYGTNKAPNIPLAPVTPNTRGQDHHQSAESTLITNYG